MFTRILVPLDGSELAERALPLAQSISQSSNATIHLVQVVSRLPELEAGRTDDSIQVAELERDAARRLVEMLCARGSALSPNSDPSRGTKILVNMEAPCAS